MDETTQKIKDIINSDDIQVLAMLQCMKYIQTFGGARIETELVALAFMINSLIRNAPTKELQILARDIFVDAALKGEQGIKIMGTDYKFGE